MSVYAHPARLIIRDAISTLLSAMQLLKQRHPTDTSIIQIDAVCRQLRRINLNLQRLED